MIWSDFECREPRCRICRHESVRIVVNQLLDWRGIRTTPGQRRSHKVTYASILRDLEPLNKARSGCERITYNSLWVHAKRHYDLDGVVAFWSNRIGRELVAALRPRPDSRPAERNESKL